MDEEFSLDMSGEEALRRLLGITDDEPDPSPEIPEDDDT